MNKNRPEFSRSNHQYFVWVSLFFFVALAAAACGDNTPDAASDAEVDVDARADIDAAADIDADIPDDAQEGDREDVEVSPPRLDVPQSVEFARAELPDRPQNNAQLESWRGAWKMARVQNTGNETLLIDSIKVKGERRSVGYGRFEMVSDFSFSIPQPTGAERVNGESPDPDNDILEWPESLAPNASFDVRVWFKHLRSQPVADELIFETNDPLNPVYSVALVGNSDSSCMEVSPETRIDFGSGSIGQESRKTIGLKNCSQTMALNIQDIEISDAAGGVFEVDPESLPDAFPDEPLVIGVGERASFSVIYRPTQEVASVGSIRIMSDNLLQPVVYRALTGQGIQSTCPIAVAGARNAQDEAQPLVSVLEVEPLSTIQLDASASSAADGSIRRYEWTLLSSPITSSATLEDAYIAQPTFEVDVVGDYLFELKVYDEQNTLSCAEPAIVTVKARPSADIYIQLTWRNPEMPWGFDQSDLDLHYLHPNGDRWGDRSNEWDCHYGNRTPDWLIPQGSPMLRTDEIYGPGPETIQHNNLESVFYKVGVHYYSDLGNGPADATVEIYAQGVLRYAARDKRLTSGQFWVAGIIQGEGHIVVPVDTVTQGFPE